VGHVGHLPRIMCEGFEIEIVAVKRFCYFLCNGYRSETLARQRETLFHRRVLSENKKHEEGRGEGRRKAVKVGVEEEVKTLTSSGYVNGRQ
jgi:hypothetical protein